MLGRLLSVWSIPDLRKKIIFTLIILLLMRVLAHITVPLTHQQEQTLASLFTSGQNQNLGQLLGLLDIFSGGSLQTYSIIAMSVYPYVTATIVMQLLSPIIPALHRLMEEGEAGRLKFSQITRIITVPLAFLQALGSAAIFVRVGVLDASTFNLFGPNWLQTLAILLSLTTGTMILVWFGELITEYGVGNGISIIILGNIVTRLPTLVQQGYLSSTTTGGTSSSILNLVALGLITVITIAGIVYIYLGQRRIPIQYPTKRIVGRGMLVGSAQTTYIPMMVNSAGMIPLIFANSVLLFPTVISQYLASSNASWLTTAASWLSSTVLNTTLPWYWLFYFVLVVGFTYFYADLVWEQQNIAENLQKQGAHIPGYRPGEQTRVYLKTLLRRVTLGGALFLGVLAVLPYLARTQMLSSTALLVVVAVALDTIRQLEAQVVMRNYSGFLS
ncbi:MAG: preprotein translocase subunit SecY [Thermogemmatispora sp.]|jgi:preprotein translocase subunit SecY|uniref:Protein translocase subunit SecY n=1 Tax=Thermogemmatispora aurantia TaxID=2045279 RepID=A0A5J4KDG3_9CHLR|nr:MULTISPECIES: preprotein translocase subunit SecY [Thermogemmatispora]MBE3566315.1 preprotein translocase subunit SecY [Thermogemmatispora sp.]GER85563.1 protein translocase subunit SecY [Thermogemmatispora aurantia]